MTALNFLLLQVASISSSTESVEKIWNGAVRETQELKGRIASPWNHAFCACSCIGTVLRICSSSQLPEERHTKPLEIMISGSENIEGLHLLVNRCWRVALAGLLIHWHRRWTHWWRRRWWRRRTRRWRRAELWRTDWRRRTRKRRWRWWCAYLHRTRRRESDAAAAT